jgi:PucR C-terminal helix-turn-helix domain/GGDEF-like domain
MRHHLAIAPRRASRVEIDEILATMSPDLDEIARALTEAIHERLEELDDDLRVGTLHSVRSNLGLMMTMLAEGTDPSEAVPPPEALAYAKEYVRRGLSFELLQRAYRTAQADMSRMWLEQLRFATNDCDSFAESVGFFNDWLFTWIEALEHQLTEVYMRERERWVRGSAAVRTEQVRAILEGAREDVAQASKRLSYDLRRHHLAYLIWRDDAAGESHEGDGVFPDMERLAISVAEAVDARSQLTIPLGGGLACWAGLREAPALAGLAAQLRTQPEYPLRVAMGLPGHGMAGFRRSHREALLARRAAEVLGYSNRGFVRFADNSLDVLLTQDLDEARRFAERELGPLAEGGDSTRRLVATLLVFLEEGASFARAARRLRVHENTIGYRVRRAEELLGHRIADRRLELHVALQLVSLGRPTAAREDPGGA